LTRLLLALLFCWVFSGLFWFGVLIGLNPRQWADEEPREVAASIKRSAMLGPIALGSAMTAAVSTWQ